MGGNRSFTLLRTIRPSARVREGGYEGIPYEMTK